MGDEKAKMPGCGGPNEPRAEAVSSTINPCLSARICVTVFAHNEGWVSPNTAALKVSGGCTPELQTWSLSTGESASIWLTRVTSLPPGAQPAQSGQAQAQGQAQIGQSPQYVPPDPDDPGDGMPTGYPD